MDRLRRKKRRRRRIAFILLPVLLILFTGLAYGGYLTYKLASATSNANSELNRGEKSDMRDEAVNPAKDNFSVLFVGIDERDVGENSRTDALILATFNKKEKSVKMVSIPRDTLAEIPEHGKDKINHAHAFGGMDMTVATVENMFDVPVDYFVKLNFNAFIEIVDSLNGVEVDVPFDFTVQDSKDRKNAISLKEGTHTLNGEEALGYVRMRKQDPTGDLGRGERQKELIKAILDKSKSVSSVTKYDNVIDNVGDNMLTNFTFGNIVALQKYASSLNNIETLKLEGHDLNDHGYYYELEDESLWQVSDTLKKHLEYEEDAQTEESQGQNQEEEQSQDYSQEQQ
ncbi:LCP family protein [Fictibacillus aquaticus]|uniref:Transcriptional regulator n=1 Tax=Fictibacillus aquaticus TaxID=2021314 RepID=A0A235FFP7_9BACL|nr:LCP family protein [Fictibacillus aquaticus]OYD59757.1 transcriptional regulator [Fictibacillus aquaticus]